MNAPSAKYQFAAWLASALFCCPAWAQGPLGNSLGDRAVLVITASYADTAVNAPPPSPRVIRDVDWVATLQTELRPYFSAASGGLATFSFRPSSALVPGMPASVTLPYTEASTAPGGSQSSLPAGGLGVFSAANDPEVLSRDVKNVLDIIDAVAPGQLGVAFRHVLVMHRAADKRGRATLLPYQALVPGGGGQRRPVALYVALVDVPINMTMQHNTLRTVSHELGHQLGMPDLYNEWGPSVSPSAAPPGAPTHEFTENWDLMGSQRLQNFSTFSRRLMGWLAPGQVQTLNVGLHPMDEPVELSPPLQGTPARPFEAVRLMYSPITLLLPPEHRPSYLIESRGAGAPGSLDNPRTGPLLPGQMPPQDLEQGLPDNYERGVLISHSKPWLAAANFPPLHPLEVKPSQPEPATARPQLHRAVFTTAPGRNVFLDERNGVRIDVLALRADGSARVRVRVTPPPRPDVVASHCWLDNPGNGFGNFLTASGADGDPSGFGDPLWRSVIVTWAANPPWPDRPSGLRVVTDPHRLSCRVHNHGSAGAVNVQARLDLLAPSLPVFGGPVTAAGLAALNPLQTINLSFGNIAAGGSAVQTVTIAPEGPFVAGLLLERASVDTSVDPNGVDELDLVNNWRAESFLTVQVAPGSPYRPVELDLPVLNASGTPRVVYATLGSNKPVQLPTGWTGSVKRTDAPPLFAALDKGEQANYRLHVQAADPRIDKPGALRELNLLAWMDEGDTWVPAQRLKLSVLLSHKTRISLAGKRSGDRATFNGRVHWLNLDNQPRPVIGGPLAISLDCGNGQRTLLLPGQAGHTARSDTQGRFSQTLPVPRDSPCVAQAHYAGSKDYAAGRSPTLAIAAGKNDFAPWSPRPTLPGLPAPR